MLPNYIRDWLQIIEEMNNDNTYKLAWGRAIIECNIEETYEERNNIRIIKFDDISLKMLKYYWNQCFYFNLKQSPYEDKKPVIQSITEELINIYKEYSYTTIPVWFNVAYDFFINKRKELFLNRIKKISNVLHQNVSYRFLNVNNKKLEVYNYSKDVGSLITLSKEQSELLKDYGVIISQLLNYKWVQLLEKYNYAPKIASKVKGLSESKIRRSSLTKYRDELLKQFRDGHVYDFYTGEKLTKDNISIDHVIPWSFVYSDDIWNLVVTSKSYNSSKSNSIPSEDIIKKLEKRNLLILQYIDNPKYRKEMENAIENKSVEKLYFDSRI